ncbi:MAG TPA: hydrogenase nickel incorporation protein HypB [Thermoanaerobaculia bacterium]|nr:hydrogenase nickel incorporation protein HypB [Thermoanaerobaculia bacterium]
MCDTCGCGDSELVPVEIQERILSGNERTARHNREHFEAAGVFAINLMGSPGSGKTAVLEATARARSWLRVGAMSGDLATDNDAERLRKAGIPAVSITTGTACHLDAELVHKALHALGDWRGLDLLVIENVGNLVCPAVYDLGQAENVVALSVTEGEDKPLKYPVMFRKADLVLVTKVDLLPYLPGMRLEVLLENLAKVMPDPRVIPVSVVTGEGMPQWLDWLEERSQARAVLTPEHARHQHHHQHP